MSEFKTFTNEDGQIVTINIYELRKNIIEAETALGMLRYYIDIEHSPKRFRRIELWPEDLTEASNKIKKQITPYKQ